MRSYWKLLGVSGGMRNLLSLLLFLSLLIVGARPSPTSGPTETEEHYESVIHANASWVADEKLWEVRVVFVNLTRPLGDGGSFNFSVSIQLNRTFASSSSIYARVEGPSGLAPLCDLCPVDSTSGLHACTSGAMTNCAGRNPIDASLIDANLFGGSLTFRVLVRGVKSGFSAGLRLSQNLLGASGTRVPTPTSSPTPTYSSVYNLEPEPINLTSVSVWLIIVVFFVVLCTYRVYRAHRINTILAMRANGGNTLGRTRGAGSAHGVEDYEDGSSAYPSNLSRHLQMNQLNMNPILQTHSARLPPVIVVDSIPSAQVRVLSAQEAAGLPPSDSDATPRAVAIGVVGTHRL